MINAYARPRGAPPADVQVDIEADRVQIAGRSLALSCRQWDVPVDGAVYGTLLNFHQELDALGEKIHQPPYNGMPTAPVMYLKTPNTFIGHGAPIPLPAGVEQIAVGAALGVVIGRPVSCVSTQNAMQYVSGFTLVNDITIPHDNLFRQPLQAKNRDGFCPIGPWIVPATALPDVATIAIQALVNGEVAQSFSLADLVRPLPQLIADLSQFFTLQAGDVLFTGVAPGAPLAGPGDRVGVAIQGIGVLENPLVHEQDIAGGWT